MPTEIGRDDLTLRVLVPCAFDVLSVADYEFDRGILVGEVYDGEWMMGIKHGYGVWKGTNGESYIGQWQAGKAQGYGVHVFANGDKYEGEWLQCLRHGNGSDFFANGDCYVG